MEALRRLADRLDEAATVLAGTRPHEAEPVGAWPDAPGVPGEVTDALRRQLGAALDARTREAAAAAARLGGLAADLRVVATGYTDADESARSAIGNGEEW